MLCLGMLQFSYQITLPNFQLHRVTACRMAIGYSYTSHPLGFQHYQGTHDRAAFYEVLLFLNCKTRLAVCFIILCTVVAINTTFL